LSLGSVRKRRDEDFTRIFESKALEKLGGSIAFVVKKDRLVWDGEDDAK